MIRYNVFSERYEKVRSEQSQVSRFIYRNFPRAVIILSEMWCDNCFCDSMVMYPDKQSLISHLIRVHKKKTMEYFRDHIMILTHDALQRLIQHE